MTTDYHKHSLDKYLVIEAMRARTDDVGQVVELLHKCILDTEPLCLPDVRLAVRNMYEAFGLRGPEYIIVVPSPLQMFAIHNVMQGFLSVKGAWQLLFGELAEPQTRCLPQSARVATQEALTQLTDIELGLGPQRHKGDPRHYRDMFIKAMQTQKDRFYYATSQLAKGTLPDLAARVLTDVTGSVTTFVDEHQIRIEGPLDTTIAAHIRDALSLQVFGFDIVHLDVPYKDYYALIAAEVALSRIIADELRLPVGSIQCKRAFAVQELIQVCRNFLPYSNVCFVLQNPTTIRRDPEGVIHHDVGPAMLWEDGFDICVWHGVRFPRLWLRNMTPTLALQQTNVELRRVACELVGWDRILNELPHKIIDKNPDPLIGTLVHVELPGAFWAETWAFLRVRCGTSRQFALPVPPTMRTAQEANAWTYGLAANEYQPEVRT